MLQVGRNEEARTEALLTIKLDPNFPQAYYNLANSFALKGELAQAIQNYRKAVQFKPDYPEAHYNLGVCLIKSGEKLLAVTQFREALKWRPDYQEARAQLDILDRESQR